MVTVGTGLRNRHTPHAGTKDARPVTPDHREVHHTASPLSECVPAGQRGMLRGSNCTMKWFQQS